jgi:hypothetical protein
MPLTTSRMRPIYLLVLLPFLLYGGAHYYVGYRIAKLIERANMGSNRLTLVGYDYSLLPLSVSARGLRVQQDRGGLEVAGTIDRLTLRGVHVFSLFGDDPLHVRELRISGSQLRILRSAAHNSQKDGSSSSGFLIDRIQLTDNTVSYLDSINTGRVANLSASGSSLRFPLSSERLNVDSLGFDTLTFSRTGAGDRFQATNLRYVGEILQLSRAHYRRDVDTDLSLNELYVSGLSTQDFKDGITLDTIAIRQLGGGARVGGGSETREGTERPALRVKHLTLPDVNVDVSGAFGEVSYTGGITAEGLRGDSTLAVAELAVEGEQFIYDGPNDLYIRLSQPHLRQQDLDLFPLADPLGATRIRISSLLFGRGVHQLAATDLRYDSEGGGLTAVNLALIGHQLTGKMEQLQIADLDRSLLVREQRLRTAAVTVSNSRIELGTPGGDRYRLTLPEVRAGQVRGWDPLVVRDVRLSKAAARGFRPDGQEKLVMNGLDLEVDSLPFPFRAEQLGPAEMALDSLVFTSAEGVTRHGLYGSRYRSESGTFTLDSVVRKNAVSAAEMFRRRIRRSSTTFSFDSIRVLRLDYNHLLQKRVTADSLFAADFRLRVVENLDLDLSGEGSRMLPLQALRSVGWPIRIGGVRVRSTDIAYGIVDSVLDSKTIHFTEGDIDIWGVDTRINPQDSIRLAISTTFEGTSPIRAVFTLPRDSTGRSATMRGRLLNYHLVRINPLMRVAADAIIESGQLDSLVYDGTLSRGIVTGRIGFYYRELDVKVTGNGAWIKNLLSGVVVKNENPAGEDFRPGTIYYVHRPEKSFFNAYWQGIVTGLRSTVLSDIVLPDELE